MKQRHCVEKFERRAGTNDFFRQTTTGSKRTEQTERRTQPLSPRQHESTHLVERNDEVGIVCRPHV